MSRLRIIKIGGNIIDDAAALSLFLRSFAALPGPNILVHGGGRIATDIGYRLGIEPRYTGGRRITDAATLELVTMVYGGLVNKQIVAGLQAAGCNAIGFTGADGNTITGRRRPVTETDFGFVGDITQVNSQLLHVLLQAGITPVLAPLIHDGAGGLLNTNADTIAREVATAMAPLLPVRLIYCFEQAGVLLDPNDSTTVIHRLDEERFRTLKEEGIVTAGMIPKLENAFAAVRGGAEGVVIGRAAALPELISGTAGTLIQ